MHFLKLIVRRCGLSSVMAPRPYGGIVYKYREIPHFSVTFLFSSLLSLPLSWSSDRHLANSPTLHRPPATPGFVLRLIFCFLMKYTLPFSLIGSSSSKKYRLVSHFCVRDTSWMCYGGLFEYSVQGNRRNYKGKVYLSIT